MPIVSAKQLLEAGVHFGHRTSRWNPKMKQYIFGKRNLIHIINLRETIKGVVSAYFYLRKLAAEGRLVLFVGTKRQAKNVVATEARRCGMPFVNERWIGGTLTNFETVRSRLDRLNEIESMEADGSIELYNKKERARFGREKRKLVRNLEGIRTMSRTPAALVIVDPKREKNALNEARKLNLTTICLVDTDSDPDEVDIVIPCNDDAMRVVQVICGKLADAVLDGQSQLARVEPIAEAKAAAPAPAHRAPAQAAAAPGGAPAAAPRAGGDHQRGARPGGPGRGGPRGPGGPGGKGRGPRKGRSESAGPAPIARTKRLAPTVKKTEEAADAAPPAEAQAPHEPQKESTDAKEAK
jgi:small subunit ribosomal protein S2